jgi:beta-glucosidase
VAAKYPFLDPELPGERRIDDLLGRLTLEEKIGQMLHESRAVDRLGVPAYNWWNEACHGVGRNGRATVFPQVIGLGATWNRALVQRVAGIISDEARAKHHAAVAAGRRGQYQGLTFWTPNINIFRDPRWGRGQETFGEDPYLMGELGLAMVRGLQGDDARYMKAAACAKHFAVHSGPERERHGFDARPTRKDLFETYLPAFEKLVRGGVEAVMGAYNRTLGEPCCASAFLLKDILRGRWGFKGHVVSDCGALDDIHVHHKVTRNEAESAALAVRNSCDLNCGGTYNHLLAAVKEGLIGEAEIDSSVRRLLATKLKLGLLDPQERVPWSRTPDSVIDCDAHRAVSRQAAVESIVLLKNNGVLPLRRDHESVLVTGPTAANTCALLGDYFGISSRLITLMEGITEAVSEGCRIVYRTGCPLLSPPAPGVNYTFGTAAENEITIAVLGLDPSLEGEEGDAVASPTATATPSSCRRSSGNSCSSCASTRGSSWSSSPGAARSRCPRPRSSPTPCSRSGTRAAMAAAPWPTSSLGSIRPRAGCRSRSPTARATCLRSTTTACAGAPTASRRPSPYTRSGSGSATASPDTARWSWAPRRLPPEKA